MSYGRHSYTCAACGRRWDRFGSPGREVLLGLLDVAVRVAVDEVARLDHGAREQLAQDASQLIAQHGDVLLFGGVGTGGVRPRDAFAALARALAIVAHLPGGVVFAGRHWCTMGAR